MKKLLVSLLCVMMMVTFMPAMAWAEGEEISTLQVVNDLKGPTTSNGQPIIFNNAIFADGKDVTVEPNGEENGLLVTIGGETYTYASNDGSLNIFAGSYANESDINVEATGGTITIKAGANVGTIFGGGYAQQDIEGTKNYSSTTTGTVKINIEDNATAKNIYGGGMTAIKDKTSKVSVENVTMDIAGTVMLVYAGPNAATGATYSDAIKLNSEHKLGSANNSVKKAEIDISGNVKWYFGSSFSYGAIEEVNCTVSGQIGKDPTDDYSAVSGANGYTGKATMKLESTATVIGTLYMSMRGVVGDVSLDNNGTIGLLTLNPDGKAVSSIGNVNVENKGTIQSCYFDCGCNKSPVIEGTAAYPTKITVNSENAMSISTAHFEANPNTQYTNDAEQELELTCNVSIVGQTESDNAIQYSKNHTGYTTVVTKEPTYTEEGSKTTTCACKEDTKTESIPKLVYTPPTPAEPEDNVTNNNTSTGDKNTTADIKPSTPTTDGKVEATVDKETADKIVDKAVENGSTEVVIDAGSGSTTTADKVAFAEVKVPTETMQSIVEKTDATVTIKTDAAEVTLDRQAVEAVATQAAEAKSETVALVVEKTKDETKEMNFELSLVTETGKVSDFNGGKVSVTVKLNATLKDHADENLVCVYIDDNGIYTIVDGKKNADGTYTFVTGHFSTYAIMTEEEADKIIKEQQIAAVKAFKITTKTELVKGKKMIIKWTVKGDESAIDGYRVYYSTKKVDKGFKVLADVKGKKLNHTSIKTNKNIKKGTRVYYRVKAYKMMDGLRYLSEYSTAGQRTWK